MGSRNWRPFDPVKRANDWLKKNGAVETAIWEPVPDNPGMIRIKKTRELRKVFTQVKKIVDRFPAAFNLEYISFGGSRAQFPESLTWVIYAAPGTNEGHFVRVAFIDHGDRKNQALQPFAMAKTFGGWELALRLANFLTVLLHQDH